METENKSSGFSRTVSSNNAYNIRTLEMDNGKCCLEVTLACSHPFCNYGESTPHISVDNLVKSVRLDHGDDCFADRKGSNADMVAYGILEYLNVTGGNVVVPDAFQDREMPIVVRHHSCLESAHQHDGVKLNGAYNARYCKNTMNSMGIYSTQLPLYPLVCDSSLQLEDTDTVGDEVIGQCGGNPDCLHAVETARVGGSHPSYASSSQYNMYGQSVSLQPAYEPSWPDSVKKNGMEETLKKQLHDARGVGTLVHDRVLLGRQRRVSGRRGLLPATCCEDVMLSKHGVFSGQQLVFTADGTPTQWFPALCSNIWSKFLHWDFDIFELDIVSLHKPLSSVLLYIAHKEGWFQRFGMDKTKFAMFVSMLESGYSENPYHNRTHAADVVHGLYSLICQYRDGRTSADFATSIYGNEKLRQKYEQTEWYKKLPEEYKDLVAKNTGEPTMTKSGLALCDIIDDIDIFALILAASLHDSKHPGCTNVHLLIEKNALAGRFRGLGILEHWHTLESFKLQHFPQSDILSCFDTAQMERIQETVVVLITGTDMQQHGSIHMEAKELLARVQAGKYTLTSSDKRVLQRSVVHYADIANPCKPLALCSQWAERVWEEWHVQREKEAVELNLHVHASVLMREFTVLPQSQIGFLRFIAMPYASTISELLHVPVVLSIASSNLKFWEEMMRLYHQTGEKGGDIVALGREIDQLYLAKAGLVGDVLQELSQARKAHRTGTEFTSQLDPTKFIAVLDEQDKELLAQISVERALGPSQ